MELLDILELLKYVVPSLVMLGGVYMVPSG